MLMVPYSLEFINIKICINYILLFNVSLLQIPTFIDTHTIQYISSFLKSYKLIKNNLIELVAQEWIITIIVFKLLKDT